MSRTSDRLPHPPMNQHESARGVSSSWLLCIVGVAWSCGGADPVKDGDGGVGTPSYYTREQLMDPETCKTCHQKHYDQWSGSMHAYASDDPLFLAMNARGQREAKLGKFCVNCHAPMAVLTGATQDGLNLADLPQSVK